MLASCLAALLIVLVAIVTPSSADYISEGHVHSDRGWLGHKQLPRALGPWHGVGVPFLGYIPVYPPTTTPEDPYEGGEAPETPMGSKSAPTPKKAQNPWYKPPKGSKPAPTPKKAQKPWYKPPKGNKPGPPSLLGLN